MLTDTIKITSNGQITLPKKIRNILNTDIILFEVTEDHNILVRPIHSVAGSLKKYSKDISFSEARDEAWQSIADDWQE